MTNHRHATRPHPDTESGGRTTRHVTVNLRENPLTWLHARGLVSDVQHCAGDRLRCDYERAGLSARTTMRWDAPPPSRTPRGAPDAGAATLSAIDARRRFHAAIDAVGPGLADICWRVLCAGDGMADAEKSLGWPARSGRLVLTLALDRLARHYGMG